MAAELLAEQVESELGLFDQELAKLAGLAGEDGTITAEMVRQTVGGWRRQDGLGHARRRAGRRYQHGAGAIGSATLGRQSAGGGVRADFVQLAAVRRRDPSDRAGRKAAPRHGPAPALERAGVKPFLLGKAEDQLRRLGRDRANRLYRWLLEADLALKGSSSSPARARLVLEQLIVRISARADRPGQLGACGSDRLTDRARPKDFAATGRKAVIPRHAPGAAQDL